MLNGETLQTILLKTILADLVNSMRDLLTQGKYVNDYHKFEQTLHDEINTRKMSDDAGKGGGTIGGVSETPCHAHHHHNTGFEEIEVWSDGWGCYICGLAPRQKRGRSRSRSRSRGDDRRGYYQF